MSISTYGELKTAVANWLNRTDLTSRIPEFIALAETTIAYGDLEVPALRVAWLEKTATLSVSSSTTTLPSDFLEMKAIRISSGGDDYTLDVYSAENQVEKQGFAGDSRPTTYSIDSDGTTQSLRVYPPADATYTCYIRYYGKATAFSSDSDTSTTLSRAAGVYLHGALREAYRYTRNPQEYQNSSKDYANTVGGLNKQARNSRYGAGKLATRPGHSQP